MSSSVYTCLGCDASFGTRKQLSAHASQCRLNLSLADQVFERKRKSSKRHTKDEKRARPIPAAGSAGPSVPHICTAASVSLDQGTDMFDQGADIFDDTDYDVSYAFYLLPGTNLSCY